MKSRTIKFRVRNKEKNYWVHGPHEDPSLDGVDLFGECILLGGFMNVPLQELNECVALQYTGLNDKNGREIFEGDIVTSSKKIGRAVGFNGPFLIRYNKFLCNFALDLNGEDELSDKSDYSTFRYNENYKDLVHNLADLTGAKCKIIGVIGNIFDNPELLKSND